MTKEERFLITAHAEGGLSVSVAGSTYRASAMAITPRVSARTAVIIIRGTTRIDSPIKAALTEAVSVPVSAAPATVLEGTAGALMIMFG